MADQRSGGSGLAFLNVLLNLAILGLAFFIWQQPPPNQAPAPPPRRAPAPQPPPAAPNTTATDAVDFDEFLRQASEAFKSDPDRGEALLATVLARRPNHKGGLELLKARLQERLDAHLQERRWWLAHQQIELYEGALDQALREAGSVAEADTILTQQESVEQWRAKWSDGIRAELHALLDDTEIELEEFTARLEAVPPNLMNPEELELLQKAQEALMRADGGPIAQIDRELGKVDSCATNAYSPKQLCLNLLDRAERHLSAAPLARRPEDEATLDKLHARVLKTRRELTLQQRKAYNVHAIEHIKQCMVELNEKTSGLNDEEGLIQSTSQHLGQLDTSHLAPVTMAYYTECLHEVLKVLDREQKSDLALKITTKPKKMLHDF
ncbi:MAG: hypothetical protein CMH57_07210 [Myxococcales bacterium]|nr:hypothetical protein [Myxococcales bacterium]